MIDVIALVIRIKLQFNLGKEKEEGKKAEAV